MAIGAGIVASAYVLLGIVSAVAASQGVRAGAYWLVVFFAVLTLGELFILPVGLGLFARLAPPGLGATTIAAWFLAAFGGYLLAGALGTLWSRTGHTAFFICTALLAAVSGGLLLLLGPLARIAERETLNEPVSVSSSNPPPHDAQA